MVIPVKSFRIKCCWCINLCYQKRRYVWNRSWTSNVLLATFPWNSTIFNVIIHRTEHMSHILFRYQPYCYSCLWLEGGSRMSELSLHDTMMQFKDPKTYSTYIQYELYFAHTVYIYIFDNYSVWSTELHSTYCCWIKCSNINLIDEAPQHRQIQYYGLLVNHAWRAPKSGFAESVCCYGRRHAWFINRLQSRNDLCGDTVEFHRDVASDESTSMAIPVKPLKIKCGRRINLCYQKRWYVWIRTSNVLLATSPWNSTVLGERRAAGTWLTSWRCVSLVRYRRRDRIRSSHLYAPRAPGIATTRSAPALIWPLFTDGRECILSSHLYFMIRQFTGSGGERQVGAGKPPPERQHDISQHILISESGGVSEPGSGGGGSSSPPRPNDLADPKVRAAGARHRNNPIRSRAPWRMPIVIDDDSDDEEPGGVLNEQPGGHDVQSASPPRRGAGGADVDLYTGFGSCAHVQDLIHVSIIYVLRASDIATIYYVIVPPGEYWLLGMHNWSLVVQMWELWHIVQWDLWSFSGICAPWDLYKSHWTQWDLYKSHWSSVEFVFPGICTNPTEQCVTFQWDLYKSHWTIPLLVDLTRIRVSSMLKAMCHIPAFQWDLYKSHGTQIPLSSVWFVQIPLKFSGICINPREYKSHWVQWDLTHRCTSRLQLCGDDLDDEVPEMMFQLVLGYCYVWFISVLTCMPGWHRNTNFHHKQH